MFFALLLYVASVALTHRDMLKYDSSILSPPGLSVNPLISIIDRIIWLRKDGNSEYIKRIESLLNAYGSINCTNEEEFCRFNIKNLGPCAVKPYGYDAINKPFCVYLQINKIFHWVPECHNDSLHLPLQMPIKLRTHIQNVFALHPDTKINFIWVSCNGQNAVDRDKIGHIEYYPYPGFHSTYFPYTNKHVSMPIVGVMFYGVTPKSLVNVKCHVFAKNIPNSYYSTFQVYIDGN